MNTNITTKKLHNIDISNEKAISEYIHLYLLHAIRHAKYSEKVFYGNYSFFVRVFKMEHGSMSIEYRIFNTRNDKTINYNQCIIDSINETSLSLIRHQYFCLLKDMRFFMG